MTLWTACVNLSTRILHANSLNWVSSYFLLLLLISFICNLIVLPNSYLSSSGNFFNVYFMKPTYWYDFFLLIPFVLTLHFLYNFGRWRKCLVPALRVFINCVILYTFTLDLWTFRFIYGTCDQRHKWDNEKFICDNRGYKWTSFNISGHIFRNLFAFLFIGEELEYFRLRRMFQHLLSAISHQDEAAQKEAADGSGAGKNAKIVIELSENEGVSRRDQLMFVKLYPRFLAVLKVNICLLAVLVVLIHVANLVTVLYFHNPIEHFVAGVPAFAFWYVCYRVIYPIYGETVEAKQKHWIRLLSLSDAEFFSQDRLSGYDFTLKATKEQVNYGTV